MLSEAGDWLLHIALPLAVLQLSGSALVTAVTFVLGLAPGVLAGPAAGVIAERLDRRTVLVAVSLAQCAVLLPLLTVHSADRLWVLYLVTAAESVLAAVFEPTKNAVVPALVPQRDLVSANGLLGLTADIGRLAGGPLGGLMLQLTGLTGVVVADAASFALVALLVGVWLPPVRATAAGPRRPLAGVGADLAVGLRTIARAPALRGLVGSYMLMSAAQGMFLLLFVLFVTRVLHGGDAVTGLLRGVQAVGGIAGGLLVGTVAARLTPRTLTGWGLVCVAACTALIWNGPLVTAALGVYIGLYIAMGVPAAAAISGLLAGAQAASAEPVRVRVLAVLYAAGDAAQVVATLLAGVLVAAVPLGVLLNAQALLYLAAGVLALLVWRGRPQAEPPQRRTRAWDELDPAG